ncbi:MAG: arylsulfatase [Marinilabiliales bacterium]|nr:arylsulfatase [Marinilabiliales bacterium]
MKRLSLLLLGASQVASLATSAQHPNIVFILADDLGYADLGCYGQQHFETPNIDRLAQEGMRFTRHYAGCTVSAPSRSSLMTGLHTGHAPIRGNKGFGNEGEWPVPAGTFTLAGMLKSAGYRTGAFGKWGLGSPGSEGDPLNQGFDTFFGFNSQTLAHNYYADYLWDNDKKFMIEENRDGKNGRFVPDLIHQRALQFLEENKEKPFFLFYPTTIPHAELVAPEEEMARFRGKFPPEKSFKGTDKGQPGFRKGPYGSQLETHAAFAAMVTHLDRQVGEIMAKLKELGLDQNTLVIFSSDNGPHIEGGADPDFFDSNGPCKGFKRDLYEGGIRIPMITRWPGHIQPGKVTDHASAFWDFLPTLAELTGQKIPDHLDGLSFLPLLIGKKGQQNHRFFYWEFHELKGRQAILMGNWKLIRYQVMVPEETTTELYDLSKDPGETHNLAARYPAKVALLLKQLKKERTVSAGFPFPPVDQQNF